MKHLALPNQLKQNWPAGGKSYHLPLVPFRPIYDAPGCLMRGEPELVTLRDQRG